MKQNAERPPRKFLTTVYSIQQTFGSQFGHISWNFSFGIKPTKNQEEKLEVWFTQVNEAKKQLYQEIYNYYTQKPFAYLGSTFEYTTFFKGNASYERLKVNQNLIENEPVFEGLSMELRGSIRSFITNNRRIYDENISELARVKNIISGNDEKLKSNAIAVRDTINESIEKIEAKPYDDIIISPHSLEEFESLLLSFNELIAAYNYEANQINTASKLGLHTLDKVSRLPIFPGISEKQVYEAGGILNRLKEISLKPIQDRAIISFLQKAQKKLERIQQGKKKRFEDRVSAYIYKKYGSKFGNDQQVIRDFTESLNSQVLKLESHVTQKLYDGASRNKYFELVAFRARLTQPEIASEINTVLSQVKSYFLQGKS